MPKQHRKSAREAKAQVSIYLINSKLQESPAWPLLSQSLWPGARIRNTSSLNYLCTSVYLQHTGACLAYNGPDILGIKTI